MKIEISMNMKKKSGYVTKLTLRIDISPLLCIKKLGTRRQKIYYGYKRNY